MAKTVGRRSGLLRKPAIAVATAALAVACAGLGLGAQAWGSDEGIPARPDDLAQVSGFPTEGRFIDGVTALPEFYQNAPKNEANAQAHAPARYIDRNGFLIQPVPFDSVGYNNTYLDAENRGCTSCHTLENALMSLPTYHRLIIFGYPTEQTIDNCTACHRDQNKRSLANPLHTIHLNSAVFKDYDNGSCQSCHVFDASTQDISLWDFDKYKWLRGIKDVSAEDAGLAVSYDQTTLTPPENRYFKTIKDEPNQWLVDDSVVDESIYENWVISIDGDCENPVEMTLPELVEQFGTVTQVMKNDCTINGVGQATIMQVEVEGVPVSKIIEYAKPKEGANVLSPISPDGYNYAQMSLDWVTENDALIVTKMDGEPLPNSQGYPCALWVYRTSGGNFTKRIGNLTFMTVPDDQINSQLYLGDFVDGRTGEMFCKPNSGVLNYPTGVVLQGDEAKTVHIEGFADAWDEPIEKLEFSLDHGATWTTLETPENNPDFWTYWRLDFNPPQAGSYLLTVRTTSITPEGEQRVCQFDNNFMFTVDE